MPRTARLSFFVTVLVIMGFAFSTASRHWAQEHQASAASAAGAAHVAHRDDCANMAALLTVLPTTGLMFTVEAGQTGEVRVHDAVYLSRQAGLECAGATFSVPVVVTYSH